MAVDLALDAIFDESIDPLPDCEFPKTFFSSVTRKTFGTVGVDPAARIAGRNADQATLQAVRRDFGFDRPMR